MPKRFCWSTHFRFVKVRLKERATMRAEFERNWPALVAYIKEAEAQGRKRKGDVLFTLGEAQDGPSIDKIVWYLLHRAVLMSTKRAA